MQQGDPKKRESRALGWLFIAAMALHVLCSLSFGLLEQKGIEPPVEIMLVFSELSVLFPAVIFVLAKKLGFRRDLRFRSIRTGTFFMCMLLAIVIMPIAAFFNVLSQLFVSNTMAQMSDQLLGGSDIAVLLLGAVYGPFCEEFVFRSVFANRYETIAGPLRGALISAMLFALAHMNINQACYAFVLGFIFAVVNKAAGSVWPSVIIHASINAFNIGLMFALKTAQSALGADADLVASAEAARTGDMIYVLIAVTLVIGMICTAIAIPCVVFVAKHEGNEEELVGMFTKRHERGGWLSIPLVLGILFVLFVMFGLSPIMDMMS